MPAGKIYTESIEFLEVGTDKKKIRQVLIKAGESLNGYIWPESVLKAAIPLFQGVKTFQNHGGFDDYFNGFRSVGDVTGWVENVEWDDKVGGLVADRYFTANSKGQDAKALIMSIVDGTAPADLIGASVSVLAIIQDDDDIVDGETVPSITEITYVFSVDDVDFPAAGGGFQVAAGGNPAVEAVMKNASYEEWLASRKDYSDRLRNELKVARQDKAVKDLKVEIDKLEQQVFNLCDTRDKERAETQRLTVENNKLRQEASTATKQVRVGKLLSRVRLPVEWKAQLEAQLLEKPFEEWEGVIQAEQSKARRTAEYTRSGASDTRERQSQMPAGQSRGYLPLDSEDFQSYRERRAKGG